MEEKTKIMIVDDNKKFVELLELYINSQSDMEVVSTSHTGKNVIDKIKETKPDILLLDIVMPERDGLFVLEDMVKEKDIKKPMIIIMSSMGQETITKRAIKLGAVYYVLKPFEMPDLVERLRDFQKDNNVKFLNEDDGNIGFKLEDIEVRVTNIMHEVGVPAHIKGYKFIKESLLLAVKRDDAIHSITKNLYPTLAEKFKTTPSKVERGIRHAIEVAWNRGEVKVYDKIFGYTVNSNKGKPTNSEFIAMLADRLLLEEKINA